MKKKYSFPAKFEPLFESYFRLSADDDSIKVARNTAEYKLCSELFEFYKKIDEKEKSYIEYSGIATEAFIKMKNSVFGKDDDFNYVQYFNKIFRNEYLAQITNEKESGRTGLTAIRKNEKKLYDIVKYKEKYVTRNFDENEIKKIGESLGWSDKKITSAMNYHNAGCTVSLTQPASNESGEKVSLIDNLQDKKYNTAFEELDKTENIESNLQIIDTVFCKEKQGKQIYISALLTADFYDLLWQLSDSQKAKYKFINMEILRFPQRPSHKEIEVLLNKKDSSKVLTRFYEKVKIYNDSLKNN